ncbi:hypothetical protein SDC9_96902 [bioreactor metagenome]|uniref:Uncharacterized protein n=1 Tax=bioreactor metagenome TaxID=1076179 RepID=A0A645AB76_9ZZZZ
MWLAYFCDRPGGGIDRHELSIIGDRIQRAVDEAPVRHLNRLRQGYGLEGQCRHINHIHGFVVATGLDKVTACLIEGTRGVAFNRKPRDRPDQCGCPGTFIDGKQATASTISCLHRVQVTAWMKA